MVGAARWGIGLLLMSACADRPLEVPLPERLDLGRPDLAVPADLGPPDLAVPADLARDDLASRDLLPRDLLPRDLLPQPPVCSTVMVSTYPGAAMASFMNGVAVDAAGYVYVGDWQGDSILKIAPDGTATTFAGNGSSDAVDGTGGPNGTAQFHHPYDLQFGHDGYLYVADFDNDRIRKVAPDGTTTTLTGNGQYGYFDGSGGFNGTTELRSPAGLALDGAGAVYIADYWSSRIRKVAPDGTTGTLAGNGASGHADGSGGPNGTAEFTNPVRLAADGAGNLYVSEARSTSNPASDNCIRKIAPDGTTRTLAGNGTAGRVDGPGAAAEFNQPFGIAVDAAGTVYVADFENHAIRQIAPDGATTTLAGSSGAGHLDGDGCSARFTYPSSLTLSGRRLFVIDEPPADGGYLGEIRVIQLP
jgi:sugar lactone lactonase YvrE